MPTLSLRCACVLLPILAAGAVEPAHEVRLHLGSYIPFEDADSDRVGDDGRLEGSPSGSFEVIYRYIGRSRGPLAGYVGGGLFARGYEEEDGDGVVDTRLTIQAAGIIVQGGLVWAPASWYQLQVGPSLALGAASSELEAGGSSLDSSEGRYWGVDLRAENVFRIVRHIELLLGLGYGYHRAAITYEDGVLAGAPARGFEVRYDGSGAFLLLGAGVRF